MGAELLRMPGPKPKVKTTLTSAEREILERWNRQREGAHSRVQRARIVLMASAGEGNAAIGHAVGLGVATVRMWRARWQSERAARADAKPEHLEQILEEILADAPRPGTPATFSSEQVAQIVAVGCEKPADSERPVSHWTAREVTDEVIKRGIVKTISVRQVARFFLKRTSGRT